MKKILIFISVLTVSSLFAQTGRDSLAVIRVAATEGYVGAYFNLDVEGMRASLHPRLIKQRVKSVDEIQIITVEDLIKTTSNKKKKEVFEDVKLENQILDMTDKMAAVRVTNVRFWDFIFLAKFDTTWLVTNVIWDRSDSQNPEGQGDVRQVAVDFVKSLHTGDVKFLEKFLHPEVDIRKPVCIKEVDSFDKCMLLKLAKSGLWKKCDCKCECKCKCSCIKANILDELDGYASVKVKSNWGTEYLHMRYIDDQWFIMNGLWNRSSSPENTKSKCEKSKCCEKI